MTYEEIEFSYKLMVKECYNQFFKENGFKIKGGCFYRELDNVTQVFFFSKLLKKRKTGFKVMTIQPQFGFFNSEISKIIWPDNSKNHIINLNNCFLQFDLGIFSGETFYEITENDTESSIKELIQNIVTKLNKVISPIFQHYKSLNATKLFLNTDINQKSIDKIYSKFENQKVNEVAFKIFYYGLAALFLFTEEEKKCIEILKRKLDILSTPTPCTNAYYDENGKYVIEEILKIPYDTFNDLPFIKRLSENYNLTIN